VRGKGICVKSVLGLVQSQSLEVSKIKKNKKNFEKFWSSIRPKFFEVCLESLISLTGTTFAT
jgi:hypothetical protein